MATPNDTLLLQALDRWEQAWSKKDADALKSMLSQDCTLHADGVLFETDLQGADAICDVHRRYFSKFDFKHETVAQAADLATRAGFGFWQDYDVHRKEEEGGEGTKIAGMWKCVFNQDCSAIQDIYFLRQLHQEEAEHKLKDPKSIAKGGVDASRYPKTTTALEVKEEEKQKAARHAAEQFSKLWQTGETSIADTIMEDSIHSTDLMHGGELEGRQAWCDMIDKVFEDWKPTKSTYDVGVSLDGRFALVHWVSEGDESEEKREHIKMYGMNMLVINPDSGKICESVGFRQLSPVERENMLKADAFASRGGGGGKEQ